MGICAWKTCWRGKAGLLVGMLETNCRHCVGAWVGGRDLGWERATRGGRETHAEWGTAGLLAGRLETNFKCRAFLGIVVCKQSLVVVLRHACKLHDKPETATFANAETCRLPTS